MAKQKSTRTKPARASQARKPSGGKGGRTPRRGSGWSPATIAVVAVAVLVAAVVLFWVTRTGSEESARGDRIEHIHGLGVNPEDGKLYAAAHNGVFRLTADGRAQRVGDGEQDTMGFTIVGADHFLGSGHPAQGTDGPANLGLIESTDGGRTWHTLSLEGEADFHALRFRHGKVYGYNAGQLMVSDDKQTWETRSQVALRDFAVSPSDPDTLVASGEQGMMRSTDGGRDWSDGGAAVMLLDWPADDQLWAVGVNGEVMRSSDGGANWSDLGAAESQVTAFAAHERALYVATHDGRIQRSTDSGETWDTLYS